PGRAGRRRPTRASADEYVLGSGPLPSARRQCCDPWPTWCTANGTDTNLTNWRTGQTTTFGVSADRDDDPIGTGDGVVLEVDHEAVLGKQPHPGDQLLGLALRLDTFIFKVGLELAGAIDTV